MPNNTSKVSTMKGLEQGRAEFAYKCVNQMITLKDFEFDYRSIKSDKIKSIFEDKFKKEIVIGEKDEDKKKNEKKENKKILDEFLKDAKNEAKEYSKDKEKKVKKDIADFYMKKQKEYKSYVKKIPMLIKTNGLGATFAFMLSKGGIYEIIGSQILEWLKSDEKNILTGVKDIKSFKGLNKRIISLNSPEYRALTIEVLAFFNWLRRFADGLIEDEDEEGKD